ncbi:MULTISPECIES: hypothetical protein [Geobacillus]|uniref:hypothetical protein n=1 Tax=Geobacillus TaxID=129337 RepID=UPI000F0A8485|nr:MULTISPECIES: hypothetical protein [Geobacillus]
MLRKELRAIVLRPKVFVPILAVLFIPLLYSGSFLWAFWDPYGHLDRLPVASSQLRLVDWSLLTKN